MTGPTAFQDYSKRTPDQIVKDLNAAHDLVRAVRRDAEKQITELKRQLLREKIKSGALSGLFGALLWKGAEAMLPWFAHLSR